MKCRALLIAVLLVAALLLPAMHAAAPVKEDDNGPEDTTATVRTTEKDRNSAEPVRRQREESGEVEYPMTPRETRPPTTARTTIPPTSLPTTPVFTQTVGSTTPPRTTATPLPPTVIVTVTVPVYYPSGPVYYPYYSYPDYAYGYERSGMLTVTSDPSDATIYLDGYNYGTTPFTFTGLSTGYHTLEVNYPGYEAYISNVYLDRGQSTRINADLVPLYTYGSLYVDSSPRGADVYVDGNYEGTSPVTVSALSDGYHRVELHKAGYEVLIKTETVSGGRGSVVRYTLVPLSGISGTGAIEITAPLPGALVYLDGNYRGSMGSGQTFSLIAVSPGSHDLLLHVPGYADYRQAVAVGAGQTAAVSATFTPQTGSQPGSIPASAGTGSMVVTSAPAGGQVMVDNVFRGVAPVTIYNISAGSHIVNIRLAGYADWSGSVDVPVSQVAQVPATLTPAGSAVPAATRTSAAPSTIAGALCLAVVFAAWTTRPGS